MVQPPDPFVTDHVLGLSIFAATLAWIFCVTLYSITAKWWKNAYGINTWLVSFIISIALARLTVLVLAPGFLSHQVSDWIGIFTYIVLTFAGFQRAYLIDKAQREGENNFHKKVTQGMK